MSAHSTYEPLAQTKPQLSEHHHPQVTQLNHKKYINSHTTLLTYPSLSFPCYRAATATDDDQTSRRDQGSTRAYPLEIGDSPLESIVVTLPAFGAARSSTPIVGNRHWSAH